MATEKEFEADPAAAKNIGPGTASPKPTTSIEENINLNGSSSSKEKDAKAEDSDRPVNANSDGGLISDETEGSRLEPVKSTASYELADTKTKVIIVIALCVGF